MDVVKPRPRRIAMAPFAGVVALALTALGAYSVMSVVRPHATVPAIERASVITDVVRRGTLVRSVSAPGAFVPSRIAVVAAPNDGLIADVVVRAGSRVGAGSTIARLRNPDLEAEVRDLDAQIAAATAQQRAIGEEAQATTLQHRGALRAARADSDEASTQLAVNRSLHDQGLIADLPYRVARIKAASANDRQRIEAATVDAAIADGQAKVAAQRAVVAGLVARRDAKRAQLAALAVVAGESGVVQSVSALAGARVTAGAELARIAGDRDLEAVLQVAETDARAVVPGLRVRLDTGSEKLDGVVTRIEPSATNGTIPVHVALAQQSDAIRPQTHVDGAIEIGRVPNAVSVARPAGAADGATVDLFRVDAGERTATRVRVSLGSGPADRVQVRAGLAPGDIVIVSDTSAQAGDAPRINLR